MIIRIGCRFQYVFGGFQTALQLLQLVGREGLQIQPNRMVLPYRQVVGGGRKVIAFGGGHIHPVHYFTAHLARWCRSNHGSINRELGHHVNQVARQAGGQLGWIQLLPFRHFGKVAQDNRLILCRGGFVAQRQLLPCQFGE